jgi:hypothetical protein
MTLSAKEREILTLFARGSANTRTIAATVGAREEDLKLTIDRLCRYDRARAERLLVDDEARQPKTAPAAAAQASSYEALLDAAEKHDNAKIRELAIAARRQLDTLADRMEEDERKAAARARIAQLKAELAAELANLNPPKPKSVAARRTESRKVRAWARANNVEVSARGQISGTVLDAYRKANPGG